MPNKQSATKAWRQSLKRRTRNVAVRTSVKKLVKTSRTVLISKDKLKAQEAVKVAIKALDRAAQKKVISKNAAARKKSRLSKQLASLK